MPRRWIIRSFFIALLLLFVTGWVVSYKYYGEIIYRGRYFWYLGFDRGEIHLWWSKPVVLSWGIGNSGWDYDVQPVSAELDSQFVTRFASPYCLGFSARAADGDKMVTIPFWFPTTLAALLLLVVWRKTRRQNPTHAFPVTLHENPPTSPTPHPKTPT